MSRRLEGSCCWVRLIEYFVRHVGNVWRHDCVVVCVCITFRCNRYKGDPQESLAARRASVERYIFHRDRYENHEKSLKLERNLYTSIESKMEDLREVTLSEVQFLKKVRHLTQHRVTHDACLRCFSFVLT